MLCIFFRAYVVLFFTGKWRLRDVHRRSNTKLHSRQNFSRSIFKMKFKILLEENGKNHIPRAVLPLTEDHFVMGNTPANLHMGLDIGGRIQDWALTLSPASMLCRQDQDLEYGPTMGKAIMDHSPSASTFRSDYVEVGPIN